MLPIQVAPFMETMKETKNPRRRPNHRCICYWLSDGSWCYDDQFPESRPGNDYDIMLVPANMSTEEIHLLVNLKIK